jgi:predicted NACHT family NTPase
MATAIEGYLKWVRRHFEDVKLPLYHPERQNLRSLVMRLAHVPLRLVSASPDAPRSARVATLLGENVAGIPFREVLKLAEPVLVSSGAGFGKSFGLTYLAWRLAEAILEQQNIERNEVGLQLKALPLPINLPLGLYGQATGEALGAFLNRYLRESEVIALPEDFFEVLLRNGKSVALSLDGLDEIVDETARRTAMGRIHTLLDAKPALHVVLTSRPEACSGPGAPDARFVRLKPAEFTSADVKKLVDAGYQSIYL